MVYNNPHRKSRNIIIGLVVAEQLARTLGSVFFLSKINKVLKISSPLKGGLRRSPKIPDRQLRKSAIVKLEALKRNRGILRRSPKIPDRQLRKSAIVKLEALKRNRGINSVGRKDELKLGGINSVGRKDELKLGNTFDNIIVENTTSKSSWVKMVRWQPTSRSDAQGERIGHIWFQTQNSNKQYIIPNQSFEIFEAMVDPRNVPKNGTGTWMWDFGFIHGGRRWAI